MIIFKRATAQNFLSIGNEPVEIPLDTHKATLITGENGCGKTTLIEIISFTLFGKPFRNIPKPKLVNSVNKKKCETGIEFIIGPDLYEVKRGMKPALFEIYKNKKPLPQESDARDFQKMLEKTILKLNHKSFHQIVILGSTSYVPFMKLASAARREIIEDLLDINIFSKMNVLLKAEHLKVKEQIKAIEYNQGIEETNISNLESQLSSLSQITDDEEKRVKREKEDLEGRLVELDERRKAKKRAIAEILIPTDRAIDLSNAIKKQSDINSEGNLLMKNLRFFKTHDNCPTCQQRISQELKNEKTASAKNEAIQLTEQRNEVEKTIKELEGLQTKRDQIKGDYDALIYDLRVIENEISGIERQVQGINETKRSKKTDEAIKSTEARLSEAKGKLSEIKEEKNGLTEESVYNLSLLEMLKDGGIKTKIIQEYLPVMNKLINQMLDDMGFFVSFNLDDQFNEVIRSRYRDEFAYDSFSEGEKQRINMALMFTWRHIARMKNSVATNLLIMDEVMDSSLDETGIDALTKILNKLDNTNIFIISHRPELNENLFDRTIEVTKPKNFSQYKIT